MIACQREGSLIKHSALQPTVLTARAIAHGEQGGPGDLSSTSMEVMGCTSQAVARQTPCRVAVFSDWLACSESNRSHPLTRTQWWQIVSLSVLVDQSTPLLAIMARQR